MEERVRVPMTWRVVVDGQVVAQLFPNDYAMLIGAARTLRLGSTLPYYTTSRQYGFPS